MDSPFSKSLHDDVGASLGLLRYILGGLCILIPKLVHFSPFTMERQQDSPSRALESSTPLDIPKFSSEEIYSDRSTASVRGTANYLSIDFAMLGRVDIAVSIQDLLHNREYIPEGMRDSAINYWPCLNFAYEAAGIQGPNMDSPEQFQKRYQEEVAWVEKECFRGSQVLFDPEKHKRQGEVEQTLKNMFEQGIDNFPEDEVAATLTELSDLCEAGKSTGFQEQAVRERAIDYFMKNGLEKDALKMLDRVVEGIETGWTQALYGQVPKLRYAWRLLVTGVLRRKLCVDDKELERKGDQVVHTIEKRLRDGPIRRPLETKSTNELIDMIEANLHNPDYPKEFIPKPVSPKPPGRQRQIGLWNFLRKPPAPKAAIVSAEERLGVQLPEDFKSFLHCTNGFARHNYTYEIDVISGTEALE